MSIEDFKLQVMSVVKSMIEEYSLDITKTEKLYDVIMDHIVDKIFGGTSLSKVTNENLVQALSLLADVRKNFTYGIVKGIFMTKLEGDVK